MERLTETVCNELRSLGADIVGVGDISQIPARERLDMPVGVAVAVKYPGEVIRGIGELPTREYYEYYNILNDRLDMLVTRGAELIRSLGYEAVAQTRELVAGWERSLATRLPHKTVATRAGLGWIGKCALLVTKEYGSAVRLSSILTNAPLEAAAPVDASGCGDCRACADACPGAAVSGRNWRKDLRREEFFDAHRCRDAARDRAKRGVGEDVTICGKCIEACPYTRRYTAHVKI